MSQLTFGRSLVLLFVVAAVYFTELGGARLWDRDEPRNSRASQEMLARGDWVVPTFNGELRDHKPVLLYWAQMACYQVLGESEFTARLPSVLCSILAILAVAVLASRLSGHSRGISHEGFWAAGGLATCLLFVMAGRAATPDACLIAFSTLGMAALVISTLAPVAPYSTGAVRPARWLQAMFGYAMLGLAALAKGPVGIILPLAVVHAWWALNEQLQLEDLRNGTKASSLTWQRNLVESLRLIWKAYNPINCLRTMWLLRFFPGVVVALAVCVPWYYQVGVATDGAFLRGFFLEHNVGRAVHSMEGHGGNVLFYPIAFLAGTFPWSMWLIPIVMWCRRTSLESPVYRQTALLAAAWVSVYLVAFTIASTKLPSYISPCYPGAALAIGCYLRNFEIGWSLPSIGVRRTAYALTVLVGVGIAGGLAYLSSHEVMPLLMRASMAGIVVAAVGVAAWFFEATARTSWVPTTWLFGAAAFQTILFGFGAKSVDNYRDDLALLAEVQSEAPVGEWMTIGGMEPSWVYYLGTNINEVRENPTTSEVQQKARDFLASQPNGKLIAVGDDAINEVKVQAERWAAEGLQLQQLGAAKRFLREGELAIFSVLPGEDGLAGQAELLGTAQRTARVSRAVGSPSDVFLPTFPTSPSQLASDPPSVTAKPSVTVKLTAHPLPDGIDSSEAGNGEDSGGPAAAVDSEPLGVRSPERTARSKTDGYPNPLRR